jgi:hypothetical protein
MTDAEGLQAIFEYLLLILSIPVGLFIFLILFSWIVALAADPYAGLPSRERKEELNQKEKRKKE